jgi:hypothetical protein
VGMVNSVVFFEGLLYGKDSWVEVSIRLLGVFLPIFAVVYVAIHIKYGDDAIIENVKRLYLEMIPKAIMQIEEKPRAFYKASIINSNDFTTGTNIDIETNYDNGRIEADFIIRFKREREHIIIRLEINHRRINFDLYLTKSSIEKICGLTSDNLRCLNTVENTKLILGKLGHSISGANYGDAKAISADGGATIYQSGYIFIDRMIYRELLGNEYLCLVANKSVSPEFIWDSGERFYFCFDLMLMLRAMLDECPLIRISD